MGIHREVTAEMKTPQEHLGKISLDHPCKNPKIPASRSMLLPEVWEMIQAGSSIKIPSALPRDSCFIRKNILYSHLEQRRSQNSPAGATGNDRSRQSQGFPSGTGISHSRVSNLELFPSPALPAPLSRGSGRGLGLGSDPGQGSASLLPGSLLGAAGARESSECEAEPPLRGLGTQREGIPRIHPWGARICWKNPWI